MAEEQDIDTCWQLLDRLAQEQQVLARLDSREPAIPADLIQPIVKLWQRQFKEALYSKPSISQQRLPTQVAKQLWEYEQVNLIALNEILHAMILDASSHFKQNHKEGVHFADRYLSKWIREYLAGRTTIAPDVVAVGSVLHAWVESGLPQAPQRVERYLLRILPQLDMEPNQFLYSSAIAVWAKIGHAVKAHEWLERMIHKSHLQPDLRTWNTLLSAWAKRTNDKKAADHAEEILQQMKERYQNGTLDEPPDVVSYSILLDAWAKKAWKNPKAAQRAQELLEQMKQDDTVQPNRISYNTVISAHARAGNPQEAEALLLEMMERASNSPDEEALALKPNATTCAAVMGGWSRLQTFAAAERAETLLREVMPKLEIQPTEQAYSNCITCWAKVSPPSVPRNQPKDLPIQRAQALFDDLQRHPDLAADVVNYTALMNVYGRHSHPSSVETILYDMLDAYERSNHDPKLQPNVHSFTTIMSAWSHSQDPHGAERAEAWLHRMETEFGIQPNVVSYSTLLDAWAKRSKQDPRGPDRARALLERMRRGIPPTPSNQQRQRSTQGRAGQEAKAMRPNIISFTTVIRAYAQQGRAEEAEALLEELLVDRSTSSRPGDNQDQLPQPDHFTFSSVLVAWSKSNSPEAAERAEAILVRMQTMYNGGRLKEPPNAFCYSNVLACWARVPGGAERAEAIFRAWQHQPEQQQQRQQQRQRKADEAGNKSDIVVAMNTVLNAWANQAKTDPQALDRIDALWKEFFGGRDNRSLEPDEFSYRTVWKAMASSHLPRKTERARHLLKEMRERGMNPTKAMLQQQRRWQARERDI